VSRRLLAPWNIVIETLHRHQFILLSQLDTAAHEFANTEEYLAAAESLVC